MGQARRPQSCRAERPDWPGIAHGKQKKAFKTGWPPRRPCEIRVFENRIALGKGIEYRQMVYSQLSGFVLAGGKSSRMGQDKAALTLNGRTLLEHALTALRGVCRDVAILGRYDRYGALAPVYEDIFPGCGPLGGIHAALSNSHTQFNLVIAVDTPFLAPDFLSYLAERAIASSAVVTTPEIDDYTQPLCTVYSLDFLPIADRALQAGNYKIVPLFPRGQTLVIKEAELRRFAFGAEMFENLNTPEDMDRARRRFSGLDS